MVHYKIIYTNISSPPEIGASGRAETRGPRCAGHRRGGRNTSVTQVNTRRAGTVHSGAYHVGDTVVYVVFQFLFGTNSRFIIHITSQVKYIKKLFKANLICCPQRLFLVKVALQFVNKFINTSVVTVSDLWQFVLPNGLCLGDMIKVLQHNTNFKNI